LLLCHNVDDHEGSAARRALARAAFGAADAYVVHSEADRDELSRRFSARPAAVLPLPAPEGAGVGRLEARRRLGAQGPLVLFLGLVRPYKGVDLLLEAAPRIVHESDARLAIVGEVFPASRGLRRVHASSPVRERILWKDEYVTEEEMGLWLAACDVVVLPYTRISGSAIAARAIGARRPIVAASVGGLPEAVIPGVTGELFPPGDAGALADAVRTALERGPSRYAAGLERAAEQAAWPRYAAEILTFIERVVNRRLTA
jgi:glycosyltransferase involved in cell wall biosynthesis